MPSLKHPKSTHRLAALLLLTQLSLAGCGDLQADVDPTASIAAPALVGGNLSQEEADLAVGTLYFQLPGKQTHLESTTAVLIAPDVVLAPAHALIGFVEHRAMLPESMAGKAVFRVGISEHAIDDEATVRQVVLHPDFREPLLWRGSKQDIFLAGNALPALPRRVLAAASDARESLALEQLQKSCGTHRGFWRSQARWERCLAKLPADVKATLGLPGGYGRSLGELALVFLSKPLQHVQPLALYRRDAAAALPLSPGEALAETSPAVVVGQGSSSYRSNGTFEPIRRRVELTATACGDDQLVLQETQAGLSHGDLGSPLLTPEGSVAALSTAHFDPSNHAAGAVFTAVEAYLPWIDETLQLGCLARQRVRQVCHR